MPILAAAVLFGVSAPLSKILLGEVSGVMLASLLYLGSGIGLLFYRGLMAQNGSTGKEAPLKRTDILWLAGAVFAGGVAAPIALLTGLSSTPSSVASLLLCFEGVSTALIAALFFKESVDGRTLAAVFLILLGSVILTFQPGEWTVSAGALSILAACVFWGMDNNFTRNISYKDPVEIVTIKGLCAGSFSLILALLLQNGIPGVFFILSALLLGFFSYGLSTVLFVYSLRNLGAARSGALFGIAPFIGAIASFLLLHEEPNILFITALPLMLIGVYLLVAEKHDHLHTHDNGEHEHPHQVDEHHTHEHDDIGCEKTHLHPHIHEPLTHKHSHAPDTHHRHNH